MEQAKRKNEPDNLRRYWGFFIPLALLLALMVRFPLRIDLREAFWDAVFYGTISLICIAIAIRVYRRFGKHGYRLIALALLCSLLSGWHIFDLYILRYGNLVNQPTVLGFGPNVSPSLAEYDGIAWYALRFKNDEIRCHFLYERYYGNYMLAITLEINRNATWFACGG